MNSFFNMNTFDGIKNKELLYNLLLNNNLFSGLNDTHIQTIRNQFEENIISVNAQYSSSSLINKNKAFTQNMIRYINSVKQQEKISNQNSSISSSKNVTSLSDLPNSSDAHNIEEIYTAEDIRNKNIKSFENNLQSAQSDFADSMKLKQPDDVSFNDSQDDGPMENMDDILAKTIAERNFVVQNIQYDENAVKPNEVKTNEVKTNENQRTAKNEVKKELMKEVTIDESENRIYEHNDQISLYKMLTELKEEHQRMKEVIDNIYNFLLHNKPGGQQLDEKSI